MEQPWGPRSHSSAPVPVCRTFCSSGVQDSVTTPQTQQQVEKYTSYWAHRDLISLSRHHVLAQRLLGKNQAPGLYENKKLGLKTLGKKIRSTAKQRSASDDDREPQSHMVPLTRPVLGKAASPVTQAVPGNEALLDSGFTAMVPPGTENRQDPCSQRRSILRFS